MRYTIRIRHVTDRSDKWTSAGFAMFPGTPEGLRRAEKEVKMLNGHPGNPGRIWIYRVFEYHGRHDYRQVAAAPEEVKP